MTVNPQPVNPQPANTLRGALIIVGSIVIVGLLVYAVFAIATAANRKDASEEISISSSFDAIDVTAEMTDVTVRFDAVDEAIVEFDQRGANRNMSFDAVGTGATLEVTVIEHGWQSWFLGDFGDSPRLTITLPAELASDELALALETDVGDVELDGDFGQVTFVGTVGELHLNGSATTADIETTVGDITVGRYSVSGEADIRTSTGNIQLELGDIPSRLEITSNVGDVELVLPEGEYRIDTSTNVGDVTVEVENDPDADTTVRIETTVGDITVRN